MPPDAGFTPPQDYLHSLGKARTAQVQKDARIGEAEAKRDAGIREAKAKQEKVSAQCLSEIEMAKAQRDYELKKATYDIEVNTRRAQADLAYQLQVSAVTRGGCPGCSATPPLSHLY